MSSLVYRGHQSKHVDAADSAKAQPANKSVERPPGQPAKTQVRTVKNEQVFWLAAHSGTCSCLLNRGSSLSEMEQLLCTCSGFLYVGMESLVANIPPATLAALHMSGTVKPRLLYHLDVLILNVTCTCCPTCDATCRILIQFWGKKGGTYCNELMIRILNKPIMHTM